MRRAILSVRGLTRLVRAGVTLLARHGLVDSARVLYALARRTDVPVPSLGALLPFDSAAGYHILHSTEKIQRLASYVETGDLVFDFGAHAGLFSLLAARRGARVIAVEPDPLVCRLLRSNTAGMAVTVVEAAVGLSDEPTTLWRVPSSTQASSTIRSAAEYFGASEAVSVQSVRYGSLTAEHGTPDVLKVDIQGSESELLRSMELGGMRTLLIELTNLDSGAGDLVRFLSRSFSCEPIQVNPVYGGHDLAFVRR